MRENIFNSGNKILLMEEAYIFEFTNYHSQMEYWFHIFKITHIVVKSELPSRLADCLYTEEN